MKKKLKKRKAITRWVIERGISEDKLQPKVKKKSGCEPDQNYRFRMAPPIPNPGH